MQAISQSRDYPICPWSSSSLPVKQVRCFPDRTCLCESYRLVLKIWPRTTVHQDLVRFYLAFCLSIPDYSSRLWNYLLKSSRLVRSCHGSHIPCKISMDVAVRQRVQGAIRDHTSPMYPWQAHPVSKANQIWREQLMAPVPGPGASGFSYFLRKPANTNTFPSPCKAPNHLVTPTPTSHTTGGPRDIAQVASGPSITTALVKVDLRSA